MLDAEKRVFASLTASASQELIASGVAAGGMQAKLDAALSALENGVQQVRIAPGASENVLERILAGEQVGTNMMLNEVQAA